MERCGFLIVIRTQGSIMGHILNDICRFKFIGRLFWVNFQTGINNILAVSASFLNYADILL
jgi:hypothetical protein